jgi:hypothetical protein
VRASPKVGGEVEVAHEFLKRFPLPHDESDSSDEEEIQAAVLENEENNDDVVVEEMTEKEAMEEGFYHVANILKKKYRKGWYFLTSWENWPLADATWEPVKTFVLPDGRINEKFKEYCQAQNLDRPLREAAKLADRRMRG